MGTDIHLYCEYRSAETNMEWFNCDHYRLNPFYNKLDKIKSKEIGEEYEEEKWWVIPAYDDRNYTLFGILAGIRTNENKSIDYPRGLPVDASKIVNKEAIHWKPYGYSHSWLTIRELIEYLEAYPKISQSGMVSPENLYKISKGEVPNEWCASTNNKAYTFAGWLNDNPIKYLIEGLYKRYDEAFYIYEFYSDKEKEKRRKEHLDDFRIVFWFDS